MTPKLHHWLLAGLATAAIGTLAAPTVAQPASPDRQIRLFSAIDRDKDSVITKDEYKAYRDQMFTRHDRNGDGVVAQEEMMGGPGMHGGRGPHSGSAAGPGSMGSGQSGQMSGMPIRGGLANLDTDKDGKISKSEWDARTEQLFATRDRNKDGQLKQDEMGPLGMGPPR